MVTVGRNSRKQPAAGHLAFWFHLVSSSAQSGDEWFSGWSWASPGSPVGRRELKLKTDLSSRFNFHFKFHAGVKSRIGRERRYPEQSGHSLERRSFLLGSLLGSSSRICNDDKYQNNCWYSKNYFIKYTEPGSTVIIALGLVLFCWLFFD